MILQKSLIWRFAAQDMFMIIISVETVVLLHIFVDNVMLFFQGSFEEQNGKLKRTAFILNINLL